MDEISEIFSQKLEKFNQLTLEKRKELLEFNRAKLFKISLEFFELISNQLKSKLNGNVDMEIQYCEPGVSELQQYYWGQIIKFASQHQYYFNRNLPIAWIKFKINVRNKGSNHLITTLHHRGVTDGNFSIGAFIETQSDKLLADRVDASIPLDIKPYTISLNQDLNRDFSDLDKYLESLVTVTLAHIANEL